MAKAKDSTPAALKELAKGARKPARKAEFIPDDADESGPIAFGVGEGLPAIDPADIPDTLVTKPAKVNVRAADNLHRIQQGRPVQFDADCGLYHLVNTNTTTMVHGNVPHTIPGRHVFVDFAKGPISLFPGKPGDDEKIELLRKEIDEPTDAALINGLHEVGDGMIPQLTENWATLKAEKKLEAVKSLGLNIERAIKWEIQNDGSKWLVQQLDALLAPVVEDGLSVDEPEELVDADDADVVGDDEAAE